MNGAMRLNIKNLRLETILGIFEWEKTAKRSVILNINIIYDFARAAVTDAIEDALDYASLEERLIQHVQTGSFNLIERLVSEIGELIMGDARVQEVTVEADKPGALKQADSVSLSRTFRR